MKSSHVLSVVLFLCVPCLFAQNAQVKWFAFSMGYVASSSSNTMARSIVGQPFIGLMQEDNQRIQSGFLADTLFQKNFMSVKDGPVIPNDFGLRQNYPNPFNPSTTIRYELPKSSIVRLSVYDILGREVSVLVNGRKDPGVYEVKFDPLGLASGVYFYRLQAGDFTQTKRLLLLR
jgi:hypothetical protein